MYLIPLKKYPLLITSILKICCVLNTVLDTEVIAAVAETVSFPLM